jgi:ketosteroid isomerase-like protein
MPNLTKSVALLSAAALIVSVSACQKYENQPGGNAATPAADTGAVTDAIKADEKKWNEDFHAKNMDALLAHYAPDAYAVLPGAPSVTGDSLRKLYADAVKDANFDVSFSSDKIDVSGDLAYSRGHFTEKYTDPNTKAAGSNSGSYITVYKKQSDGSWKVVEDFAAIEPPAVPAAPAAATTNTQ